MSAVPGLHTQSLSRVLEDACLLRVLSRTRAGLVLLRAHLNCATMEAFRRRGLLASVLRWGVPVWRGRGAVAISGESAASGSVAHDAPAMSRQDAQAYGVDAEQEARTS